MKNKNLFPMERNRYFYGKMLTARDLEMEQKYLNDKRRVINSLMFGAGIVSGLDTYRNDESSISIKPGMALDYTGREIIVDQPVIRKLAMIEGYESLFKHEYCYLCLNYDETGKEPVNNIGIVDRESEEFNKILEGYKLKLSVDTPDFDSLYKDGGKNTVTILYQKNDICLLQIVPNTAISGKEFVVRYMFIKNMGGQSVSAKIEFSSDYIKYDDSQNIIVEYSEAGVKNVGIYSFEKVLQVPDFTDMHVAFSNSDLKVSVQVGEYEESMSIPFKNEIFICADYESQKEVQYKINNAFQDSISKADTPIYIGKIDYVTAGNMHMIKNIVYLPFGQKTVHNDLSSNVKSEGIINSFNEDIETETYELRYWQKPEVKAEFNERSKKLNLKFGMPSTEAYDYTTSTGVINVPIPGTIKVNSRFISDEFPHNLGIGNVCVNIAVEFFNENERCLLLGNGEIFASKGENKEVPKIESAVIVYPERGTFRVGLWCHNYVDGLSVNVSWFAYKATRDSADMRKADKIEIKIVPDISRIKIRGKISFKAIVTGSIDKDVIWSVKDVDGGTIDINGFYLAPSIYGTFEIVAKYKSDESVTASAFVIVEE